MWAFVSISLFCFFFAFLEKPKLLKIYSPQQTYQTGVVVRIQCEFEGSPTGDVSWTKDGRVSVQSGHEPKRL